MANSPDDVCRYRELLACFESTYSARTFDISSKINALRAELRLQGTDLDAACSHDGDHGCWLLSELSPWNEILLRAGAGLYEEHFQRLTLKLLADKRDFLHYPKGERVLAAACLLHLLLREHRCIQKFILHGHDLMPLPSYWIAILKMSFEASPGLQSLDLTFQEVSDNAKGYFFDGAARIAALKEFFFRGHHSSSDFVAQSIERIVKKNRGHLRALSVVPSDTFETQYIEDFVGTLRSCTALTSLELKNLAATEVESFVWFMIENKTVTVLILGKCSAVGLQGIARVLRANRTLLRLNLSVQNDISCGTLALALKQNNTLKYLRLKRGVACGENAEAIASMLKVNKSLLEINLESASSWAEQRIAIALAEAIYSNTTLTKMNLSGSRFFVNGVLLLVESLAHNSTLSEVRIDLFPGTKDFSPLFEAIERTRTWERLVIQWHKDWVPQVVQALQANASLTEVYLYLENRSTEVAKALEKELFESLRDNKSVTLFSLKGRTSDDVFCHLGSCLAANDTLQTLELIDDYPHSTSSMKEFSEGLAQNSSIRRVKMAGVNGSPSDDHPLTLAFGRNRSITCVDIVGGYNGYPVSDYLYLSRSIIRVNLKQKYARDRQVRLSRRFQQSLQRNLSLVNGAVRFALNPTMERTSAGLFHEFQHSPEMFRRLKEATGRSDEETRKRILCVKNFVEERFFLIVCVVKTSLVCHRVGRTVLQDLNDVCLKKIVSYLRVYDIAP